MLYCIISYHYIIFYYVPLFYIVCMLYIYIHVFFIFHLITHILVSCMYYTLVLYSTYSPLHYSTILLLQKQPIIIHNYSFLLFWGCLWTLVGLSSPLKKTGSRDLRPDVCSTKKAPILTPHDESPVASGSLTARDFRAFHARVGGWLWLEIISGFRIWQWGYDENIWKNAIFKIMDWGNQE